MCEKEFAKTPLADQKRAEFMLKMAEKIGGLSFTGLLGAPVAYWFTPQGQSNHDAFLMFLIVPAIGLCATWLALKLALDIYNKGNDDAQ